MTKSEIHFGIKFSCIIGIIGSIVYPLAITTHGYKWWNFALEMSFGPLFIISSLGIYYLIREYGNSFFNVVSVVFQVLAGAGVLIMIMVQKAVFTFGRDLVIDENFTRESAQYIFKIGNLTQLGMDFYFDVLVSVGTVFLGLSLLKQTFFPKWLSVIGCVVGAGGLLLNTKEFPIPPADSGWFDPGPFYAVFMGILLVIMIYKIFIKKELSYEK